MGNTIVYLPPIVGIFDFSVTDFLTLAILQKLVSAICR